MTLNLKNPAVYAAASELADLQGISMTEAVLQALRHELERYKQDRNEEGMAAALLEIGRRCSEHMLEPADSADHATLLYDERGLSVG